MCTVMIINIFMFFIVFAVNMDRTHKKAKRCHFENNIDGEIGDSQSSSFVNDIRNGNGDAIGLIHIHYFYLIYIYIVSFILFVLIYISLIVMQSLELGQIIQIEIPQCWIRVDVNVKLCVVELSKQ